MVDFLGAVKRAAKKITEAPNGEDTASSAGKKFGASIKDAERTAANNNDSSPPRTLVADRITEQSQANRLIGQGGDVNVRPILLNSGGGVTDFGVQLSERAETQRTTDRIEKLLDASGPFNTVSKDEINEAVDIISGLDAEEANAVFDQLNERGLINPLIKEIYDGSRVTGDRDIDDDARQEFFDNIAGKLDGENLILVTEALKGVSKDGVGKAEIREFTESISEHASDDVKLSFIEGLAAETTSENNLAAYDPRRIDGTGDPDAQAVAQVIASLKDNPEGVEQALGSLTDEQLDAVVHASFGSATGVSPVPFQNRAVPLYQELTDAVNNIDSSNADGAEQITRFIGASSKHLRDSKRIQENIQFKDAFSELFVNHFDQAVGHSLNNNGSINSDFGDDIETFSQHVLFSNPPGERQAETAEFFAAKLSEWQTLSEGGNLTDRVQIGNVTRSREAAARLTGQFLAHSLNGLQFAVEDGKLEAEAENAANKFIVNVAFDLLPGPDAGKVVDSIFGQIKGETKSQVLEELNGQGTDINTRGFDDLYETVRDDIGSSNSESTAEDLLDAFVIGFTGVRPVDISRPTS